jgi:hypothetical protein
MFSDPQVITVNAVAKSMPRISSEGQKSIYRTSDELFKLTLSHVQSGTRTRSMMRIDQRAIVENPLTSASDYDFLAYYGVLDRPEYGFSLTTIEYHVAAFNAWLTTATVGKIVGGES